MQSCLSMYYTLSISKDLIWQWVNWSVFEFVAQITWESLVWFLLQFKNQSLTINVKIFQVYWFCYQIINCISKLVLLAVICLKDPIGDLKVSHKKRQGIHIGLLLTFCHRLNVPLRWPKVFCQLQVLNTKQ